MRKLKIFLSLILAFSLGILAAIAVYFYTQGDVAWNEYIETELIPSATAALAYIFAACVAAMPIIKRINDTIISFNQATKDVNTTVDTDKKLMSNVEEFKAEMRREISASVSKLDAAVAEIQSTKVQMDELIAPVARAAQNTEEIVRIGFGEDTDLVKRGIAAVIAKVGEVDVKEDENT